MNFNRIFPSSNQPIGDDGSIDLSKEYTDDNGMTRTLCRIENKADSSLIMLFGMPFKIYNGGMIFDHLVITQMIQHVFNLSESELGRFDIIDYMKLMNCIMDQFSKD